MILSQLFGTETVIGVDIGSRLTKVVLAEPVGSGRWNITRAASCSTNHETTAATAGTQWIIGAGITRSAAVRL